MLYHLEATFTDRDQVNALLALMRDEYEAKGVRVYSSPEPDEVC